MTFRCTRHFFLIRKESMIFCSHDSSCFADRIFRNFHVFSDRKIGNEFRPNAALLFPAAMSFRTTKERITFSCIRHHFLLLCMSFLTTKEWILFCVASDNIMHSSPFAAIFSDDISLHPPLLFFFYVCLFSLQNVISALVCLFWSQKRGRQFVASVTFLVCLFWLQKTQYLVSLEMLDALFLRKEKVVLAARHRHQRFTRGRIYYISICQGTLFFYFHRIYPKICIVFSRFSTRNNKWLYLCVGIYIWFGM